MGKDKEKAPIDAWAVLRSIDIEQLEEQIAEREKELGALRTLQRAIAGPKPRAKKKPKAETPADRTPGKPPAADPDREMASRLANVIRLSNGPCTVLYAARKMAVGEGVIRELVRACPKQFQLDGMELRLILP